MTNHLKKISILLGIGIILIVGILLIFSNQINKFLFPEEIEIFQENVQEEAEEVVLIIDLGKETPRILNLEFEEGMTAFSLLEKASKEQNFTLNAKSYNMGIFIEAIGDVENGQDGKYWMYYVNGEMPQVAADKKELKNGDSVEFKFEKSQF